MVKAFLIVVMLEGWRVTVQTTSSDKTANYPFKIISAHCLSITVLHIKQLRRENNYLMTEIV